MNKEEIQNKINLFFELQKTLSVELKDFVIDKSIPLEERWEIFVKSDLGNHENFYKEFKGVDSDHYFDLFNYDRQALVLVKELYKRAVNHEILKTQEEKDLFREDVLTKFIKSFLNDW